MVSFLKGLVAQITQINKTTTTTTKTTRSQHNNQQKLPSCHPNSWEIDASKIEEKLRSDPCLLLDEENVLRAFQPGRDIDIYTNRRMIIIDTKGLTGKRVKYKSIPLNRIHGFEFEIAGHLERDAEIYLYTDIAKVESEPE
jgi:hypothetical protein